MIISNHCILSIPFSYAFFWLKKQQASHFMPATTPFLSKTEITIAPCVRKIIKSGEGFFVAQ